MADTLGVFAKSSLMISSRCLPDWSGLDEQIRYGWYAEEVVDFDVV